MNQRWNRRAVLAFVLMGSMLERDGPTQSGCRRARGDSSWPEYGHSGWRATGDARPRGRRPGASWSTMSVPTARTGASTPSTESLQVHPGDTIVFTLAPNPQAFHTVHLLALGMTPLEFYGGFSGGFIQPNLAQPGEWQRTSSGFRRAPRAGAPANTHASASTSRMTSASGSPPPSSSTRRREAARGTRRTRPIDPATRPGPYYIMSDVDGPTMFGRIDVVAPDQPVQAASDLEAAAQRQYEADLAWLAGHDWLDFRRKCRTRTAQDLAGRRRQRRSDGCSGRRVGGGFGIAGVFRGNAASVPSRSAASATAHIVAGDQ